MELGVRDITGSWNHGRVRFLRLNAQVTIYKEAENV